MHVSFDEWVKSREAVATKDKLKVGAYSELYKYQHEEVKAAEQEHMMRMVKMRNRHLEARIAMEQKCVADHGSHIDDGSMFHGVCARCGIGEG